MKITRNTSEQLIIDNAPWLVAAFVGVAFLTSIGIGMIILTTQETAIGLAVLILGPAFVSVFFWAFVRRNQLILDRSTDSLIHRRRTIFHTSEVRHQLRDLERAIVETTYGDTATHRMSYILNGGMDAGTHPFTTVYTSGGGARKAADAVNHWLSNLPGN